MTLKLAATLDGRTAAADGSSRWITGPEARADAHRLRAGHDAVLVGAGTVRVDDPALTVRDAEGPDPLRVVLGTAPATARVHPAIEMSGPLALILDDLGARGVLSVLVEGGATVAHRFHHEGLVDRYVLYLAPALMGGDDGRPLLAGSGAPTIGELWRGRLADVQRLGADLRVDLVAADAPGAVGPVRGADGLLESPAAPDLAEARSACSRASWRSWVACAGERTGASSSTRRRSVTTCGSAIRSPTTACA